MDWRKIHALRKRQATKAHVQPAPEDSGPVDPGSEGVGETSHQEEEVKPKRKRAKKGK